jgi:hypothetical protein
MYKNKNEKRKDQEYFNGLYIQRERMDLDKNTEFALE